MNKNKLERFILDNKEDFDLAFKRKDESWLKIQSGLERTNTTRYSFGKKLIGIAAAAALGLIAVWSYTQYNTHVMSTNPELTSSIEYFESTENRLVKTYHTKGIQLSDDIQEDLKNITNTQNKLKKALQKAPVDKKDWIINALIQSYELKISILEEMIEFDNKEKSYQNESHKSL